MIIVAENCTHDCSTCGESCGERTTPQSFLKRCNDQSEIKKVIAVVSGKGGVGKSSVTSLLAVLARRAGKQVAILDADITGPSIPKAFGIHEKVAATKAGMYPAITKNGIEIMSVNLLTENETDPVVWRGPMIAGVVEQFWTDVVYGTIDTMFIDMPPGTGDVPLTVFQSIPVDGIVIVTSPQELVGMIVEKAINMAKLMKVPVLGLIENMSYFKCPDCGKEYPVFGPSHIEDIAKKYGITNTAKMPLDPNLASACDNGAIEMFQDTYLDELAKKL
jgi:Mrp family chromosome partitioning ATPase